MSTSEGGANTTAVLEIVAFAVVPAGTVTAAPAGILGAAGLAFKAWRRVGANTSAADHPARPRKGGSREWERGRA